MIVEEILMDASPASSYQFFSTATAYGGHIDKGKCSVFASRFCPRGKNSLSTIYLM